MTKTKLAKELLQIAKSLSAKSIADSMSEFKHLEEELKKMVVNLQKIENDSRSEASEEKHFRKLINALTEARNILEALI